jgi:hypothetical protein
MEEEFPEDSLTELIAELRDLNIRQAEVVARIGVLTNAHDTDGTPPTIGIAVNGFKKGDRVKITNKVKKPAVWPREKEWIESQFRLATVTKVSRLQVHFLTDNGVRTWRAPNNLERIGV